MGAAGALTFREEKMVKTLLQLDTVRGPHSTGLFGAKTSGQTEIFKKMGTPWEVAEYKGWDKFWAGCYNVIIGHNRWATQGGINHANAHPFNHGNIFGVHNGTLKDSRNYLLDDAEYFEVDSENIYYHMARNGVDDTIKNLDGAFALVWYDEDQGTLNLTRNEERPLYFCYAQDRKSIFWASEDWMLTVAAAKHDVKIQNILELKPGTLFSIPVELKGSYNYKPIGEGVVVRELEQYRKPIVVRKQTPPVKKQNNVTPITTKRDELAKWQGKTIQFRVDGLDEDQSCGMEFLDCSMEDSPIEVRYFFEKLTDRINDMVDSDHTYSAVVRSYSARQRGYIVVDPRTVHIVLEESDEEKKRQKSLH